MESSKRLGILTSGGDCPGLNAVIRAVVKHASLTYDWEVVGIPYGTQGLIDRKSMILNTHGLDLHGIDPLLSMGGTILGSISKGDTESKADEVIAGYQFLGLDALIAIGGDGSLSIMNQIAKKGNWKFIAVPKTIDNDVAFTERAVGFDTAVNTVVDALQRLAFTASSHDRVMVVEVMGRDSGFLALHSGIAGGADVILIPEIPYSIEGACAVIRELRDRWGRRFAIVVVAEGAKTVTGENRSYTDAGGEVRLRGIGSYIADAMCICTGNTVEARVTVLGHVQRGGTPSALDRLIATAFGKTAVDLVTQGESGKMVAWQGGKVASVAIDDVVANSPLLLCPDDPLIQTARALGIYLGELPSQDSLPARQEIESKPAVSASVGI